MKLKLVVASMSLLGLVMSPMAFAETTSKVQHPKHHAKQHHKAKHHHTMRHHRAMKAASQNDGNMPAAPVEHVASMSSENAILASMNQNTNRGMPQPEWFNRIGVGGGMNVDIGKFGARGSNFEGENTQRLSINDAYINLTGTINDYAKVFASLDYSNPSEGNRITPAAGDLGNALGYRSPRYAHVYDTGRLNLEQGYVTLANFDASPFFVEVGKHFQDFGEYEIHPMTRSLTQVMSETLATSVGAGFILQNGVHGDVYAFDNPRAKFDETKKTTNFGVTLGYKHDLNNMNVNVGAGYLNDLMGVNDVAEIVNDFNVVENRGGGYTSRVGGAALYGDVTSGAFTVGARYTTALQRFNVNDLPKDTGLQNVLVTGNANPDGNTTGAKPWAAGIQAGYKFNAMDKDQNVYIGYQASNEASGLFLPKNRWQFGYGIDIWKNTNLGFEWNHDNGYGVSRGGNGKNYNLVSLRTAVRFG